MLGETGAPAYYSCRSTAGNPFWIGRPNTGEPVEPAFGKGIAVRIDRLVETKMQSLMESVASESSRLALLANDMRGEDKAE